MMNYEMLILPILAFIVSYTFFWLLKGIVIYRLEKISAQTETVIDDIILATLKKTKHVFYFATSLYISFHFIKLSKGVEGTVKKIWLIVLALQIIFWSLESINSWFSIALKKKVEEDPSAKTTFGFLNLFLKFSAIVVVFLFVLNNLGVNISTFIAGLGVGGVAIALATQNILGDLFSSLSIMLDKPFVVGDSISVGDWTGTVEHVGLKTTRIRNLSGEELVVSNSQLLSSQIKNFKRMTERRVVIKLGVTYQTKRESLLLCPKILEEVIKSTPGTRFARAHFVNYGDFSLNFDLVYWVTSPDFDTHMDVQQVVLFKIHETFEKNGLEFAYPTQTLFLQK